MKKFEIFAFIVITISFYITWQSMKSDEPLNTFSKWIKHVLWVLFVSAFFSGFILRCTESIGRSTPRTESDICYDARGTTYSCE